MTRTKDQADPATGELPGMPEPRPGIWPDAMVGGKPRRVYTVEAGFGSSIELDGKQPEDAFLAEQLDLENFFTVEAQVVVVGRGHKMKKGRVVGISKMAVIEVAPAGEVGYLMLANENKRMRSFLSERAALIQEAADEFAKQLAEFMRGFPASKVSAPLEASFYELKSRVASIQGYGG